MEGEVHDEDIERLANRLALLVSDDGEADNAGRAVGTLARRLGLTGGKLKEVFLTGAAAALAVGLGARRATSVAADVERLEREIAGLRQSLRMLDRSFRTAQAENEELRAEATQLRAELDNARSSGQVRRVIALIFVAAVLGGAAFLWFGPNMQLPHGLSLVRQASAPDDGRTAVVRADGAKLRAQPDLDRTPVANLTADTRLVVRRLVWNNLIQWAEVENDKQSGYVPVTDLKLP